MPDDRFVRQDPNPVPLDALKEPDWDVREYRTDEDINNIADTLNAKGQVMPILLGSQENGLYPVLDGNHRVLAAKRLGWPDIDAIKTGSEADNNEIQIVANISRLELTQAEKLATFDFMLNNLDWSKARAAKEVGFDRSQVTRYAAILTGYGEIKEYFLQGEIGVQAAYELNKGLDRDQAVDIAKTAVRENYMDKDIVTQCKHRRGEEDGQDAMRGAGSETQIKNMQQVERNKQELQQVEPIDQQAIDDAQAGSAGGSVPPQGEAPQQEPEAPTGPPCHMCGDSMEPGPLLQANVHPELAEQLGVNEVLFCARCAGKFINWWANQQSGKAEEKAEAGAADES